MDSTYSNSPHPTSNPGRRQVRIALGILAALLIFAVVTPWSSSHPPDETSDLAYASPSAAHWLGTDVHGRDMLTRIAWGARVSMLVGLVGACISLGVGVTWGMVAGYVGGRWDGILMRTVDVLYSLPSIILVIVLMTTLEGRVQRTLDVWMPSVGGLTRYGFLVLGLGAVSWLTMARIVRGQTLSLREQPFVLASRSLGASHFRILRRHILPNLTGVILVYLTLTIPSIVLYESFLSYLGLGIRPPGASLGTLIAEGASQINVVRQRWWLIGGPAGVLAIALLALTLLGDGLRSRRNAG